MDTDRKRLKIVGNFVKKIAKAHGAHFKIVLSSKQRSAIKNADYVITQIRVGKMDARKGDEYLGKRHGLIGQETTGVGGMACALRTVPVILDIARDMQKYAPEALLVNFTNPAAWSLKPLRYAPDIQSVGVCNVAVNVKMEIVKYLNEHLNSLIKPDEVRLIAWG